LELEGRASTPPHLQGNSRRVPGAAGPFDVLPAGLSRAQAPRVPGEDERAPEEVVRLSCARRGRALTHDVLARHSAVRSGVASASALRVFSASKSLPY